jgi:hypothetical protein
MSNEPAAFCIPYQRNLPLGERIELASMPIAECGCWIWMAAVGVRDYGQIKVDGRAMRAHRASWVAHNGPIPDGLHVLHKCDVTSCVNPDHLFLGTHKENMRDMLRRGRANKATGKRNGRHTAPWRTPRGKDHYAKTPGLKVGEKNGRAKLTEADVIAIRESNVRSSKLAALYGVERHAIGNIRGRRSWKHIP